MRSDETVISRGIITRPHLLGGKPTIKGTRIPAVVVSNLMEGEHGMSAEEIIDCYPALTFEDISNVTYWAKREAHA